MRPRRGWRPVGRIHVDRRREIEEELRQHLDGRIQEYVAAGLTESEARRRAEERFGDLQAIGAELEHYRRTPPAWNPNRGVGTMVDHLARDVRLALRSFRRRPGFTTAALLTLSLAVGATTAVFSVVHGVLLRPLPHPDPDQLMLVWEVDERGPEPDPRNPVSVATFHDWQTLNQSFEAMAGFGVFPITLRMEHGPEQVMAVVATADFFRVLEASTVLGRTFLPDEDRGGRDEEVAVISYEYWQSRFGGDPNVLGRALGPFSRRAVIGVLEPGFEFRDEHPSVVIPRALTEQSLANRRSHNLQVVARLRHGVAPAAAQDEMDRIVERLSQEHPEFLTGWGVNVEPLTEYVVGPVREALWVLFAAVGFVLLIACVNVANLMLTRSLAEQRVDAVRAAVGASRARLIQQRLTEAVVLSALGGGLGTAFAWVATRALVAMAPASVPRLHEIGMSAGVLGFALSVTLAVGITFGLTPALQAARSRLAFELREGSRSVSGARSHQRIRTGFAVAQVTLSLVLLVSAGLMIHSFVRLTRIDPGFAPGGVLSVNVSLTDPADSTRAIQARKMDELVTRVRAVPGVNMAGLTKFLPFDQSEWTWSVAIEGKPPPTEAEHLDYGMHAVGDHYFRTMGIPLVQGRAIEASDRDGSLRVAVVNEAFVRRFFEPGEDVVGRRFALLAMPDDLMEIVGIAGDTRHYTLDQEPVPAFFLPYRQIPYDWFITEMAVVARTAGDPAAMAPVLRQAMREVGSDLLIGSMVPMRDRIGSSLERERFALWLLVAFAVAALAIAVIGIYGLMAFSVRQQQRDIGVRIALGAEPAQLVARFLRVGLRPVLAGVVLGLIGASGFARLQASLLYEVEPVDPWTYGAVAAVLIAAAALATWLPARRAARIDPVEVLRID